MSRPVMKIQIGPTGQVIHSAGCYRAEKIYKIKSHRFFWKVGSLPSVRCRYNPGTFSTAVFHFSVALGSAFTPIHFHLGGSGITLTTRCQRPAVATFISIAIGNANARKKFLFFFPAGFRSNRMRTGLSNQPGCGMVPTLGPADSGVPGNSAARRCCSRARISPTVGLVRA